MTLTRVNHQIQKPALRYYGGKWKVADWIISFFPKHMNYLEVCGGAASVLMRKEPSKLETYNDLDGRVVNFFRVLRDHQAELIDKLKFTPWAREEWENCQDRSENPVEDARRYFVLCWQSYSKVGGSWRTNYSYEKRPRSMAMDALEIGHLKLVANRLRQVQIENRDMMDVISRYDGSDTLIYFDPPYLPSLRTNKKYYAVEMDKDQHIQAAELLRMSKGFVVVSGYASELYAEIYENHGWKRFEKATVTTNGQRRVECVWVNPKILKNLTRQGELFEGIE